MPAEVTKDAPNFKGTAVFANGQFKEVSLEDYRGKYVLLFFFPLAFSFVCPSELVALDKCYEEFAQRNVEVIGCSVDSHFALAAWRLQPVTKGGIGPVKYTLLSDLNHEISKAYGCHISPPGIALRASYLIDREGKVVHSLVNEKFLGRSVDETMRLIDALQFYEKNGELCPMNWKKGQPGMKPTPEAMVEYMQSMET